jgi:poly(3-hydroxybutyrate) depolymerase
MIDIKCRTAPRHCLAVFAAGAAIMASAIASASADETIKLGHQGVERGALLYQPAGAPRPAPLVIALQGNTQTIEDLRDAFKLDPVAEREGFTVLYPDAIEHRWSYGRPDVPIHATETYP